MITEPDVETFEQRSAMYRLKAEAAENCAAKARSKDVALAYSMLADSWTRLANSIDSTKPPAGAPHPEATGRHVA